MPTKPRARPVRQVHRVRRLLSSPLLHFLVLGAGLFWLVPEPRPVLLVAEPGDERAIDDAVLFAQARTAGLLDGPVVENRLARVGAFLSQHPDDAVAADGDPAAAVASARALGLHESDVVIRRYVSELMRLDIAREADHPLPSEAELEAHRDAHAERFAQPERLGFRHVFVSARRGAGAEDTLTQLLTSLSEQGPEAGRKLGDPFPLGGRVVAAAPDLERRFGPGFAEQLQGIPAGAWHGPVASTYGQHLVYVEERQPARVPAVDEIRGRLLHNLIRERRANHLRQRLDELRAEYDIRVEAAAPPSSDPQGA